MKQDLPHILEAEYSIIGSFFHDPEEAIKCVELLNPKYFFVKRHQVIIQTIVNLTLESQPCDLVTVLEKLRSSEHASLFENAEQIQKFLTYATHPENIKTHLENVKKYWELREVIKICETLMLKGKEVKETNIDVFLEEAEKVFMNISDSRKFEGLIPSSSIVKETILQIEKVSIGEEKNFGISSGFKDFDNITAGFQASDLVILAARPAMGKTALVLNMAMHSVFIEKKQVAIFSLEMSRIQIMQRMLSIASQVHSIRFRDGKFSKEELERLFFEAPRFQTTKLMIDDTPSLSLFDLNARCRKMKREQGACDLIIIDYLQLMTLGKLNVKDNREREISMISMSLKALAKELDCAVLACSQLNRNLENRADKRPKTSDLRESGSIEQDADLVFFIYRDEVYNKDTLDKGIAELIIGKNRHGPIDTVRLSFLSEYTSFHNLAN
jgi:replicative DNA helicase